MEAAVYRARLEAAASRLGDTDALLVAPSADLVYLTGYAPMPLARPTVLIVTPAGPTLVVPTLERPLADACPAADAVDIVPWDDGADPYTTLAGYLPPGGSIAVGDRMWSAHLFALQALGTNRRWISGRRILAPLRMRKDRHELEALRRAAAGADAALADLLRAPLAGRTERDVAATLAELLVAHGHGSAAFTIVASGPNAASPHHEPSGRTIGSGDAVVLDFGGEVDGYHSDTTRTVVVGEPAAQLREVYEIVQDAHAAALAVVRPGLAIQEVDRAARTVIAEAGYVDRFIHRTGHGIGLEIHEPPYAVTGDDTVLEPGMTFSIEPGIYLEGLFGVRIEDIVAVTTDGVESLNGSPRTLQRVG